MRAAANPAAQLMQLRESELLGILNQHHGRIRNVHAYLDDRRSKQQVKVTAAKSGHDALRFLRRQAAVEQSQP